MSKANLLSVSNLSKVYGKNENQFQALKNINLEIGSGETVAIVGKSGSGKSTLLHILALLDKPTSGHVKLNGQLVSSLAEKEQNTIRNQDFGFVFQQFFLNPNDSVLENVILPLKIAGTKSTERKKRGLEVLKTVELLDKATNKANDLSGGQKQRIAIARALVTKPKVIFADEPTGNLDSVTGKKIEDLLFALNKENGITVIFVTHDNDLASRCQRQIEIKDGKLVTSKGTVRRPIKHKSSSARINNK